MGRAGALSRGVAVTGRRVLPAASREKDDYYYNHEVSNHAVRVPNAKAGLSLPPNLDHRNNRRYSTFWVDDGFSQNPEDLSPASVRATLSSGIASIIALSNASRGQIERFCAEAGLTDAQIIDFSGEDWNSTAANAFANFPE